MGSLEGRVAIITGAGRGIGREHALFFAAESAMVVVNDFVGNAEFHEVSPAQQVVDEIIAAGGQAVANDSDVSDSKAAGELVQQAVDTFGDLHVLVNNAGILRDRTLVNMSDEEWDLVTRVHLRGHFCPLRAAARYWRDQSKAGAYTPRAVINTTSTSGLFGTIGQTNYGAAKSGIATLSIISAHELNRYGVRVNAIAPAALTRMTEGLGLEPPASDTGWYEMDPANISPFVAYLATESCPLNGRIFMVHGGKVHLFQPYAIVDTISTEGRWTVEELAERAPRLQDYEFPLNAPFPSQLGQLR